MTGAASQDRGSHVSSEPACIDVATGVVLFRTPEEIEVAAGASRQQDLNIDVVEVQVHCEAGGRNHLGAERSSCSRAIQTASGR